MLLSPAQEVDIVITMSGGPAVGRFSILEDISETGSRIVFIFHTHPLGGVDLTLGGYDFWPMF